MENRYVSGGIVASAGLGRRRSTGSAGIRKRTPSLWLLPLGAGPRLAGAALIVVALWAGFFWATSTPGGA